jgi:hypothetical protein
MILETLEQIEHCYSGPLDSELANAMFKCDPNGPLMINITKLYPNKDATRFDAFGRIFSGRIKLGESVKVLGENYSLEDEEDMALAEVTGVYINETRYRIEVTQVPAGNWVLLEGVDQSIAKTATITTSVGNESAHIFKPLRHVTQHTHTTIILVSFPSLSLSLNFIPYHTSTVDVFSVLFNIVYFSGHHVSFDLIYFLVSNIQIQYDLGNENCCGANKSFRTSENVGRITQNQ